MIHQFFTVKIVCPKYYITFGTYLHEKARQKAYYLHQNATKIFLKCHQSAIKVSPKYHQSITKVSFLLFSAYKSIKVYAEICVLYAENNNFILRVMISSKTYVIFTVSFQSVKPSLKLLNSFSFSSIFFNLHHAIIHSSKPLSRYSKYLKPTLSNSKSSSFSFQRRKPMVKQ